MDTFSKGTKVKKTPIVLLVRNVILCNNGRGKKHYRT